MKKKTELEKVDDVIERKRKEVEELNDECATKLAEIVGDKHTRILSYNDQKEVDDIIAFYTKKIARLVVDIEYLEEGKNEEDE